MISHAIRAPARRRVLPMSADRGEVLLMTRRGEEEEYVLHCMAVIAARKAAGLNVPTQTPEDPWWEEGPHIKRDGRSYYVHAMGCLQSNLGQAMQEHPDWYLVAAIVRGRDVEVHGLGDDDAVTLGEVQASGDSLDPDEKRWAIELTPREKRKGWGVTSDDRA
jgi:hypothetical protein